VAYSARGCKLDEFKLVGLHEKHALNPGIRPNNIYKFYSYLTDNMLGLHYNYQLVNAAQANNGCFLFESYETHTYTTNAKYSF
jgi:hypothetical protein